MKLKFPRFLLVLVIIALFLAGVYTLFFSGPKKDKVVAQEVVVYKSPDCACCQFWAYYMERNGYKVRIRNVENMDEIKKKYNVPTELQACHTAVMGGYVLEGHLPVEAVEKLMAEKPTVEGISLPGMPTGVPGMGGFKKGILKVFSFGKSLKQPKVFFEF